MYTPFTVCIVNFDCVQSVFVSRPGAMSDSECPLQAEPLPEALLFLLTKS